MLLEQKYTETDIDIDTETESDNENDHPNGLYIAKFYTGKYKYHLFNILLESVVESTNNNIKIRYEYDNDRDEIKEYTNISDIKTDVISKLDEIKNNRNIDIKFLNALITRDYKYNIVDDEYICTWFKHTIANKITGNFSDNPPRIIETVCEQLKRYF